MRKLEPFLTKHLAMTTRKQKRLFISFLVTVVGIGNFIRNPHTSITSLADGVQRALSVNLGNGNCRWTPPIYDVPEDIVFHKTLIAGFPSKFTLLSSICWLVVYWIPPLSIITL